MFSKIFPVILKVLPIILTIVATWNWAILQSPEGVDAIKAVLYVLLPGLAGAASAVGAFYVDSKEKQAALFTDPPVIPSADETLVSLDAPGVSLRAKLANDAAGDPAFRKRVVDSVASALEVRGGGP